MHAKTPRRGRKNPRPQKVFSDDSSMDTEECEKDAEDDDYLSNDNEDVSFPKDPEELLKYIKSLPITKLYKPKRCLPDSFYEQCEKKNDKELYKMACGFCNREFVSSTKLSNHMLRSCPGNKITCLLCDGKFASERDVKDHITVKHLNPSRRRTMLASSNDVDTEEDALVLASPAKPTMKFSCNFGLVNQPLEDIFSWNYTLKSKLETSTDISHLNILPSTLNFQSYISDLEIENCISKSNQSPPFQINRERLKQETKTESLKPFECIALEDGKNRCDITFYAGEAVWAMDWCPFTIQDRTCDQYLAISTHTNLHFLNSTYSECGIIQIWNCGKLDIKAHCDDVPQMALGLYHNFAPIWDLKWCPMGVLKNLNMENTQVTNLKRLGILAAASGSGVVVVTAIPYPSDLELPPADCDSSYDNAQQRIFSLKPDMILHPGPPTENNIYGQCLRVDWKSCDGGQWIAGAFTSGHVALWKVVNYSAILLIDSKFADCAELLACRTFRAHSKPIRGLAWCPFSNDVIATAGYDRYFKVWNINNTEKPQNENLESNSAIYTDLVWPAHWCGVYAATDEVFAIKYYRGVIYHDAYEDNCTMSVVIPFKSPCWTVTNSDWLNCVCSGDIAGSVVLFASPNYNRRVKTGKKSTRINLYTVTEKRDSTGASSNGNSEYTLMFEDTDMVSLDGLEKRKCFKNTKQYELFPGVSYDKPITTSVNCVKWNPNFGSHTWIASGLQCGLVRLHCVHAMHSKKHDKLFTEKISH